MVSNRTATRAGGLGVQRKGEKSRAVGGGRAKSKAARGVQRMYGILSTEADAHVALAAAV